MARDVWRECYLWLRCLPLVWLAMSGREEGALTLWLVVSGGSADSVVVMSDLLAAPSLIAGWQFNIPHLFNALQYTVQTRNGVYRLFERANTVLKLGFKRVKIVARSCKGTVTGTIF